MSRKWRDPYNQAAKNAKERYVAISNAIIDSEAFRFLSAASTKVYLLIRRRYFGTNNGKITVGRNEAADKLNLSVRQIANAFVELQHVGLVQMIRPGSRGRNRASDWALTDRPLDVTLPLGIEHRVGAWRDWRRPPGRMRRITAHPETRSDRSRGFFKKVRPHQEKGTASPPPRSRGRTFSERKGVAAVPVSAQTPFVKGVAAVPPIDTRGVPETAPALPEPQIAGGRAGAVLADPDPVNQSTSAAAQSPSPSACNSQPRESAMAKDRRDKLTGELPLPAKSAKIVWLHRLIRRWPPQTAMGRKAWSAGVTADHLRQAFDDIEGEGAEVTHAIDTVLHRAIDLANQRRQGRKA